MTGKYSAYQTDSGEFISQGYNILCSSNNSTHRAGVAFILNQKTQGAILGYNSISPRLITVRFQMKTAAITIIQVYAPNTADSEEEVNVMGDFNAKVGCDRTNWENVLGNYGYGS